MRVEPLIIFATLLGVFFSDIAFGKDLRGEPTKVLCFDYADSGDPDIRRELMRRKYFSRLDWIYIDKKDFDIGVRVEVLWCSLGKPYRSGMGDSGYSDADLRYKRRDGSELYVILEGNKVVDFHFFSTGELSGQEEPRPIENLTSHGTCFAVSEQEVLTSHHVVADATEISIRFQDGIELKSKISGRSQSTDLAILSVSGKTPAMLPLAEIRSLKLGQEIFTIGFPLTDILGSDAKFTEGSVSSLSGLKGDASYFQMSVPIQPGNSGGPVVNAKGEVVGVVAATAAVESFYAASGVLPQNVNWASKSDSARLLFDPPTMSPRARTRSEAIQMASAAVCRVTAVR